MIKCEKCDDRIETYEDLKRHRMQYHSHHKSSQYENCRNFEEFHCFYCDSRICSEEDLEDHYMNCQNEIDTIIEEHQQVVNIVCQSCDANCRDEDDLERHFQSYHRLENLVPDEFETTLFRCDICPLFFKKKIDLEFHARGCHWDHWDNWDQF